MVGSQDAVPIKEGWRFHNYVPYGELLRFGHGPHGLKAKVLGLGHGKWHRRHGLSIEPEFPI
jgi:hypothetical protein